MPAVAPLPLLRPRPRKPWRAGRSTRAARRVYGDSSLTLGETTINLQTGAALVDQYLDFSRSDAGRSGPIFGLVYDSSAAVPIIQVEGALSLTPSTAPAPSNIGVMTSLDGSPISITFVANPTFEVNVHARLGQRRVAGRHGVAHLGRHARVSPCLPAATRKRSPLQAATMSWMRETAPMALAGAWRESINWCRSAPWASCGWTAPATPVSSPEGRAWAPRSAARATTLGR